MARLVLLLRQRTTSVMNDLFIFDCLLAVPTLNLISFDFQICVMNDYDEYTRIHADDRFISINIEQSDRAVSDACLDSNVNLNGHGPDRCQCILR